ncbi:hypothetical protein [Sulfuriroseicoccus oceanibius]|uniref:Type II secretion system protein J n=1 Tax=Sulfuriroseicoccus oceanibius TaxID=2707525 RepID=A0A6B3LFX3_9BACT|nr:hypothetical protein [Sulfuriroseicoccus oceanibius]QQL44815.1 hypothetical protein G3M56_013185 [Sulfuriroseicoccus oceanibius]
MKAAAAQRGRAGFTLLEVLLGMAVAILVIVGVVGVSLATMRLSSAIGEAEIEEMRSTVLEQVLRDNLEGMPQAASYVSIESGADGGYLLGIEDAFGLFPLGGYGMSVNRYLFRPVVVDGAVTLRLEYYYKTDEDLSWLEDPALPDAGDAVAAIDLVGGLSSAQWWILMREEEEWVPLELNDARVQPAALRLDMIAADGHATSWTFRHPMWQADEQGGIPTGGGSNGGGQGGGNNSGGGPAGGNNQGGGSGGGGRPIEVDARPPGQGAVDQRRRGSAVGGMRGGGR